MVARLGAQREKKALKAWLMKRKGCDNRPSGSLGIMYWLPLFGLEDLAFEPMRSSS